MPRLRLLIMKMKCFMRSEKIHSPDAADIPADNGLHESQGLAKALGKFVKFVCQWGMLQPTQVPVLGVMNIREAAINQRADKIHCQCRQ